MWPHIWFVKHQNEIAQMQSAKAAADYLRILAGNTGCKQWLTDTPFPKPDRAIRWATQVWTMIFKPWICYVDVIGTLHHSKRWTISRRKCGEKPYCRRKFSGHFIKVSSLLSFERCELILWKLQNGKPTFSAHLNDAIQTQIQGRWSSNTRSQVRFEALLSKRSSLILKRFLFRQNPLRTLTEWTINWMCRRTLTRKELKWTI